MSAVCATRDCDRAPVPVSASGIVHSLCADHEREALSCFGEKWADQARAGVLRPAITGGVPIDIHPSHPDSALSVGHEGIPRSSVSCAQRGAALATQPA